MRQLKADTITRLLHQLFSRVHRYATLPIKSEHVIRLRIGTLHSGRPNRHSPHSQSRNRRFFFQQSSDRIDGDMAFDNVVLQESDVALPKLNWHTVLRVHRIQPGVRQIDFFDLEAIIL